MSSPLGSRGEAERGAQVKKDGKKGVEECDQLPIGGQVQGLCGAAPRARAKACQAV